MSAFSGPQGRGAQRRRREEKRLEAQDRQATRDHKAAAQPRDFAGQLLTGIFAEQEEEQ